MGQHHSQAASSRAARASSRTAETLERRVLCHVRCLAMPGHGNRRLLWLFRCPGCRGGATKDTVNKGLFVIYKIAGMADQGPLQVTYNIVLAHTLSISHIIHASIMSIPASFVLAVGAAPGTGLRGCQESHDESLQAPRAPTHCTALGLNLESHHMLWTAEARASLGLSLLAAVCRRVRGFQIMLGFFGCASPLRLGSPSRADVASLH